MHHRARNRAYQFQLTAARRRLAAPANGLIQPTRCFNSQPPEGGWAVFFHLVGQCLVSTHSRPKAAGVWRHGCTKRLDGFNSQPPEGGWQAFAAPRPCLGCFNSQPPEGGWGGLAGIRALGAGFNSQPPEGGWLFKEHIMSITSAVSTHSRPKAAGGKNKGQPKVFRVSTHSRPKAAGAATL